MSAAEPPDPDWNADDTSAVPVGPEPEPTGAGGSGGAGGWGRTRVEPFAVAALVWAIVSIVIPVIGTIIAFVLAARAADLIRRSRGERTGTQYVTAARIVAGAVLALWIIGGIAWLALRDNGSSNNVAVPTQPPTTSLAPITTSTTVAPATTTTTHPAATTVTKPPPTISIIPPTVPPTVPPTAAPTVPPTATPTVAPTTVAPTTNVAPTTTRPVGPTTTTPEQAAAKVQAKALTTIGGSNRGVPNDQRVAVDYTPGHDLLVTWAINFGEVGAHPTGTPTCTSPPTTSPTTTTSTTSTTAPGASTTSSTSTTLPAKRDTQQQARYEAKQLLQSIKPQIKSLHLDIPGGVQLVGTYPIENAGDDDVVQALYSKATVQGTLPSYLKMFEVPPAEVVQCLNPAFEL
jgi:hypothetical protein